MYSFYLDKTKVAEPESFSNISFEKKRDENYFGFIQRQKGTVKVIGAGQVKFTEPKAVAILKAAKDKYGYGAIVKFTVEIFDQLAYEGTVNFWNAEWYSESVVVTFSDDSAVMKFIVNASTKYQVATNKLQTLGSLGSVGKTTHQISESLTTFRHKTQAPQSVTHVVPFQLISGSSNSNVNEVSGFRTIAPIYTNDSEKKTVSVKAAIYVNAKSDAGVSVNVNDIITNTYALTTTATNYVFVIDETFVIEPYETITIKVVSLDPLSDCVFIYDAEKTVLSISETKEVIDTDVKCISSFDLLNQLLINATDSGITLQSTFLKNLEHDWSNGKNVRGVDSVINTSFEEVFVNLNKQYCLTCTITDNKAIIEERKNVVKTGSKTYLTRDRIVSDEGQAEVQLPNRDYLFSKIKVGYKNWQGESALSGQEVNALQEWITDLYGRDNTLDLECDCIASGILIEEIRQSQFGKISAEQQKKYDDILVCLIPDDGFSDYSNNGINFDSRNLSIRPIEILKRWALVMGGYQFWRFVSGLGNYNGIVNDESLNGTIITFGNIISDTIFELVYECELWEYTNVGDIIYWSDTLGNDRKGILMEAQWRNDKQMLLSIIETR